MRFWARVWEYSKEAEGRRYEKSDKDSNREGERVKRG